MLIAARSGLSRPGPADPEDFSLQSVRAGVPGQVNNLAAFYETMGWKRRANSTRAVDVYFGFESGIECNSDSCNIYNVAFHGTSLP
jgi:hypothetical protein